MRLRAILRSHIDVVTVNADKQAWDKDGLEVKLDESLILEEIEKIKIEDEAIKYKELRKPEYPAIEDQLDLLYHEGIEGWKKIIKDVKDKYPKPEAPSE